MLDRLIRSVALLAAAMVLAMQPAQAQQPARIVAVGDLHGDYDAWMAIAQAARLIDERGVWTGGAATLVQLGDITDRGADSLKILRSLQQLQRQAPTAGGRVAVLLGNHEAMNLLGDLRYVHPGEFAAFVDNRSPARRERLYMASRKQLEAASPRARPSEVRGQWLARTPLGWAEHRIAWGPGGELGRWAGANPAVLKIGSTLFAHGGVSAEYAAIGIDEINRRARAAMAAADDTPTSILNDQLGPLWYRGLITRRDLPASRLPIERELDRILAATGTRRIVVGHTPALEGAMIGNGGKLVRADSGISRHYGGQLSYVEIVGDTVTARQVPRPAARGGAQ